MGCFKTASGEPRLAYGHEGIRQRGDVDFVIPVDGRYRRALRCCQGGSTVSRGTFLFERRLHVVQSLRCCASLLPAAQLLGVRVATWVCITTGCPTVAHAAHAVAEGQLRRLRDGPRPRSQPPRVGCIASGEWSRRTPQVHVVVRAVTSLRSACLHMADMATSRPRFPHRAFGPSETAF